MARNAPASSDSVVRRVSRRRRRSGASSAPSVSPGRAAGKGKRKRRARDPDSSSDEAAPSGSDDDADRPPYAQAPAELQKDQFVDLLEQLSDTQVKAFKKLTQMSEEMAERAKIGRAHV